MLSGGSLKKQVAFFNGVSLSGWLFDVWGEQLYAIIVIYCNLVI